MKLEMQTSLDKIVETTSDDFLKEIRDTFSNIDFEIIRERLEAKYMQGDHSAMILDGRKRIHIIVDHGMNKQQSGINCKTEIKIFEKYGMTVTDHIIGEKVYNYVVQPEKEFYQELEKIPENEWSGMSVTRTISQDILGEIEKTASSIGFTLDEISQLMAENAYITELRSKTKKKL